MHSKKRSHHVFLNTQYILNVVSLQTKPVTEIHSCLSFIQESIHVHRISLSSKTKIYQKGYGPCSRFLLLVPVHVIVNPYPPLSTPYSCEVCCTRKTLRGPKSFTCPYDHIIQLAQDAPTLTHEPKTDLLTAGYFTGFIPLQPWSMGQ